MQNKFFGSKLNSVLLIILIILMIIAIIVMINNKDTYLPYFNKNSNQQIRDNNSSIPEVSDENYENQIKWATENNGLPNGWVRWNDTMAEISVEKYGPLQTGSSYIIKLNAQMVKGLDGEKKCVGDSESALCAIGNNPEVLRYFNIINYRN